MTLTSANAHTVHLASWAVSTAAISRRHPGLWVGLGLMLVLAVLWGVFWWRRAEV